MKPNGRTRPLRLNAPSPSLEAIAAEQRTHTQCLQAIHERLCSIEAFEARKDAGLIIKDLQDAIRKSEIRARIMVAAEKGVLRGVLLDTLGIKSNHLANEIATLKKNWLLTEVTGSDPIAYEWAPKLHYVGRGLVIKVLQEVIGASGH